MSDIVRIFALGGLDENGKNMYVIEINEDIFVLEAGMKYPESTMPGIDIIIPDYTYLIKNKDRVKAYIVTQGHDDCMGAITYAYKDVPAPIYCSKVTCEMIKDTARRYRQNTKLEFNIVDTTSNIEINGREFKFFSTTHSVAQTMGVAINTSQGYIVYTGDYIIDCGAFQKFRTDLKALARIAENKILCLMTESVGSNKPDYASPNHKLTPLIKRQFEEFNGRVVVALYNQNLFGIQEVINLGVKNNKKIVIFSKDMETLVSNIDIEGLLDVPKRNRGTLEDLKKEDQSDVLVIITSNGERLFRILERIANEEMYEEKGLLLGENDLIIMAAPSVPGVEVIAVNVLDLLYRTGAKIINISNKKIASMHAHEEDLKTVVSMLQPQYYIPVKGYYKDLICNATLANNMQIGLNHSNIFVLDNGMVAKFVDGKYVAGEEMIQVGELMVDGLGIFDAGSVVINDRNKLADDGVIILGVTIDSQTKEIVAGPDVQTRGLVFIKESEHLVKDVANLYIDVVKDAFNNPKLDINEKRVHIREKISKYVKKETGKDPMVLSMVVEI